MRTANGWVASTTASISFGEEKDRRVHRLAPGLPMRNGTGGCLGIFGATREKTGWRRCHRAATGACASRLASVVPPMDKNAHLVATAGSRAMTSISAQRRWLSIIGIGEDGVEGLSCRRKAAVDASLLCRGRQAASRFARGRLTASKAGVAVAAGSCVPGNSGAARERRSVCWRAAIRSSLASAQI